MAEFCKQCAEEMFGPEVESDFKGLIEPPDNCIGVLCEGCGILNMDLHITTFVDAEGQCIWTNCPTHGVATLSLPITQGVDGKQPDLSHLQDKDPIDLRDIEPDDDDLPF